MLKLTPAQADGNRGYQPVLALWAEQDVILADEFRDGNSLPPRGGVPGRGSATAARGREGARGVARRHRQDYLRGDSALYEHD